MDKTYKFKNDSLLFIYMDTLFTCGQNQMFPRQSYLLFQVVLVIDNTASKMNEASTKIFGTLLLVDRR